MSVLVQAGVLLLMLPLAWAQSPALREATEALGRGDFQAARIAAERATRAEPGSARAWKTLGMAFAADDLLEEAYPHFSRACELNSSEPSACYYLGRSAYYLSRLDIAEQAFRRALEANNAAERAKLGLAMVLEAKHQPSEAEKLFKQAVAVKAPGAEREYGMFLFRQGRGEDSLRLLELAGAAEDLARVRKELAATRNPDASPSAARIPQSALQFESIPLPMTVRNGAFGNKHLIETMMGGVAVIDFDNDSLPDLFIANGAEIPTLKKADASFANRLFRNRGNGKFEDVTAKAGLEGAGYAMGAAAGDFDADGWIDLYVLGARGNTLYRNRGDGSFEDVTVSAGVDGEGKWSVAAAWLDFDRDARLDLFVVRYVEWNPANEPFCGDARPGYRSYCHPKLYPPLTNLLYRSEGDGRFRDVSKETGIAAHAGKGMGLALGDFDDDGWPDVFVGNDTLPNFLFQNRGGTFVEIATESGVALPGDGRALSSMGASFGDFDNDGLDDLVVSALSNETFPLFRNLGKNQFQDVTATSGIAAQVLPYSGWGVGFVDLDNDGLLDIFTANSHVMDNAELTSSRASKQPNTVLRNGGQGRFRLQVLEGEAAFHRGAAFADFDGDGRMDIAVSRLNEAPILLLNRTEATGNWLRVQLDGNPPGARIAIRSANGRQRRILSPAYSYASSSEPVAHFGLGADTTVQELTVRWPDGCIQTLRDVSAGQHLRVRRSCGD